MADWSITILLLLLYCYSNARVYVVFRLLTAEPLSYSSTGGNCRPWTTPYQETEEWTDFSDSYDMDVERDSSSRQRRATSSGGGPTVLAVDDTVKSMKEIVGTGLSMCESLLLYIST